MLQFFEFYDLVQSDVNYSKLLKPLIKYLDPNKPVLDVGCGTGHLMHQMHKMGFEMIGLDIDPNMLMLSEKKVPTAKFIKHDIRKKLTNKYDQIVLLLDVMNYFMGAKKIIHNLYEALNDNGTLVLDIYKEKQNYYEEDTYEDISYSWELKTKNTIMTHKINVNQKGLNYSFLVKEYFYDPSYYITLLQEAGFKVKKVKGFDDRKMYLVCKK